MDHNTLRCTVPVEITGKICEFGLRPDRYYSRVPVDIWRLFKTTLRPLPPAESISGDDLSGCLGMCSAEFSVLNRNLSDQSVLVSREQIPTIGLSTLMDSRLVYNFGDGTVKLAEDYTRLESPRPMSRPIYDDDFQRLPDPRGNRQFDDEEYQQRTRAYEREDEFLDDRNMNNSRDRRPNLHGDEERYGPRNFDESRRAYSPPAGYRPNYPDDHPSGYRRDHGDGPSARSEFDRRPYDDDPRRPQYNEDLRSDKDNMNFQGNRGFSQAQDERMQREFDSFERNLSEQLNAFRQQSNLDSMESMARREANDNFQMKLQNEQNLFPGPSKANPVRNEQKPNKKKKASPRCSFCMKFGHVIADCHDANANKKPQKKIAKRCDLCHKIGHLKATCRMGKSNVNASQTQVNHPGITQPWDAWVLGNASSNIQNMDERAKILQMLGARGWPNM